MGDRELCSRNCPKDMGIILWAPAIAKVNIITQQRVEVGKKKKSDDRRSKTHFSGPQQLEGLSQIVCQLLSALLWLPPVHMGAVLSTGC